MTINERFKEVRVKLNKTQAEFGEQCGLGRAVIANIENNRSPVTPLYIKVVVDNFGVNENWLRTGEGSMFVQTKDDYINQLVQRYKGSDLLKKVIEAFINLNDEERKAVLKFIDNLDPEPTDSIIHGSNLKLNEREEDVSMYARNQDDTTPDSKRISKAEIEAALAERAKDDDDLK